MREITLFAHTVLDWDTTSAVFEKGKKAVWKFFQKSDRLQSEVQTFNNPSAS